MSQVVAARFAVPFYLRLPIGLYAGWEPETGVCAILNFRRLGDLSFTGTSSLVSEGSVVDSYQQRPVEIPQHQMLMKCELADGSESPTLSISTGVGPSFTELRSYSELVVFFVVGSPMADLTGLVARVEMAANHLIDIYRAVTQDPFVRRIDFALDVFVVAFSFATVPASLIGHSAAEILRNIHQIQFSQELKDHRFHYRVNTWEDLFPGALLDEAFTRVVAGLLPSRYELPLHYDLVFTAQAALKARNYHIAVLEVETAVEVFVARRLVQLAAAGGSSETEVIRRMENPRDLGLLKARIRMLDDLIASYRVGKGLTAVDRFVGSASYRDWEENLYRLRNRITHAGLRDVTFDMAKAAIGAGKQAIRAIEVNVPDFADPVQIPAEVGFLQNTAGRLRW